MILGDQGSGIRRHARQVAAGISAQPGTHVASLSGDLRSGSAVSRIRTAIGVARRARGADVLIVPHSRYGLWSDGLPGVLQILAVLLLGPPAVFVLHDVYGGGGRRTDRWCMRLIADLGTVVVQETHELRAVPRSRTGRQPALIPLPVDEPATCTREEARDRLGVAPQLAVFGVLGWIHPRKRHADVLRALPLIEGDPVLWFVGGPSDGDQTIVGELIELATQLGVEDRLLVTGYVSDDELALRLAACDVGVCAYADASASASALAWIGAGRPIVGSGIDVMRGLRAEVPGMVDLVDAGDPAALAAAMQRVRERGPVPIESGGALRVSRSVEATTDQYLRLCRALVA